MAWFGGGSLGQPTSGTPGADMGGANGQGRKKTPNSIAVGTAVTRDQLAATQLAATAPPPSAAEAASSGIGLARSAAERQRKRAAAGSTVATSTMQPGGPGAKLVPRSLIGA